MNINMMFIMGMKTISMVELRTASTRIVRELKRGEGMMLSYRGQVLAELVPSAGKTDRMSPLEALKLAQGMTSGDPSYAKESSEYLDQLKRDRKTWSER